MAVLQTEQLEEPVSLSKLFYILSV